MRKRVLVMFLILGLVWFVGCGKESPTTPVTPEPIPEPEPEPEPEPDPMPVINFFTVDPETIALGDWITLEWDTEHAKTVRINHDIGVVSESGWWEGRPEKTTKYTLKATNSTGTVTATAKVVVKAAELVVVGQINERYLWGCPTFKGWVKNVGTNIAWNADITIICYGDEAQTTIIDTAWDYLADGADIRPGQKVSFEAVCWDLNSHDQIKSTSLEIDWLEGDIEDLSSLEIQKMHENERRAQELRMKRARAEGEKR